MYITAQGSQCVYQQRWENQPREIQLAETLGPPPSWSVCNYTCFPWKLCAPHLHKRQILAFRFAMIPSWLLFQSAVNTINIRYDLCAPVLSKVSSKAEVWIGHSCLKSCHSTENKEDNNESHDIAFSSILVHSVGRKNNTRHATIVFCSHYWSWCLKSHLLWYW